MRRIVVLGGGFAGLNAATTLGKNLEHRRVDVVLVTDRNHFLYTPLLPNVATGEVNPEAISIPLTQVLPKNVSLVIDRVDSIDLQKRRLEARSAPIPFDYLITATGSEINWRGYEAEVENALTCRSATDAINIKERVRGALLEAEHTTSADELKRLTNIVVAGAGATGVELGAELHSWVVDELWSDLPEQVRQAFQVTIIEPQSRVLPNLAQDLSDLVDQRLGEMGVEVRVGERVTAFDGGEVGLEGGDTVAASTLIWAAGVRPNQMLGDSGFDIDPFGRARALPTLEATNQRGIYVVGDTAAPPSDPEWNAQVAKSQGPLAARNVIAELSGRSKSEWEWESPGELISLGRKDAAASYRGMTLSGRAARTAYSVVYAALMPNTFKKVNVLRDMLATKIRARSTQDEKKLLT